MEKTAGHHIGAVVGLFDTNEKASPEVPIRATVTRRLFKRPSSKAAASEEARAYASVH
jgi:hypothetical protein